MMSVLQSVGFAAYHSSNSGTARVELKSSQL